MKYRILSALLLAGCAMQVDHKLHVGLDDECLLRFPACTSSGYRCERADGSRDYDCEVACVAGRTLTCESDGPMCRQTIGDDDPAVPVVCVTSE